MYNICTQCGNKYDVVCLLFLLNLCYIAGDYFFVVIKFRAFTINRVFLFFLKEGVNQNTILFQYYPMPSDDDNISFNSRNNRKKKNSQ